MSNAAKPNRKQKNYKTRKAILDILKQEGPQEAQVLAKRLGVTAMGVRQHLYALQEESLLTFSEEARPMGRPAKLWTLTSAANKFFPDGNSELLVDMLGQIKELYGEDGLARLVEARSAAQLKQYQKELQSCSSLGDRLRKLAEIRTREGYMAEVREEPDGSFLLLENHCPICDAAATCQNFCSAELSLFQQALGNGVRIKRREHILAGSRRCAYEVVEDRNKILDA